MLVHGGEGGRVEEERKGRKEREKQREGRKKGTEGGRLFACHCEGKLEGNYLTAPPHRPTPACLWSYTHARTVARVPGLCHLLSGGRSLSWAVHILLGRWACSDALTVVSALTGSIHHAGPLCQHKSMVTCSKGCSQQSDCVLIGDIFETYNWHPRSNSGWQATPSAILTESGPTAKYHSCHTTQRWLPLQLSSGSWVWCGCARRVSVPGGEPSVLRPFL